MRHANRNKKIDQARRKTQNRKHHPKATTKLETNRYGNVVGIPDGWKQTNLSVAALLTARIPFYKAFLGFEKSRYGEQRPILVNIVPVGTRPRTQTKPNKHLSQTERQKSWERRLNKLTNCGLDYAHEIAEAKLAYKAGILAKLEAKQELCPSAKRAKTIEIVRIINPLRRIINQEHAQKLIEAHQRHTLTNYDQKLREAHELAENGIIDRTAIKTYARTHYTKTI